MKNTPVYEERLNGIGKFLKIDLGKKKLSCFFTSLIYHGKGSIFVLVRNLRIFSYGPLCFRTTLLYRSKLLYACTFWDQIEINRLYIYILKISIQKYILDDAVKKIKYFDSLSLPHLQLYFSIINCLGKKNNLPFVYCCCFVFNKR